MNRNYKLYKPEKVSRAKEMFRLAVNENPNDPAFKFKNEKNKDEIITKTFTDVQNDINELGTALANIGMADKHVACIGENSYRWINVYFTMVCSCGVYVPIDKELNLAGIVRVLKHSESEVLFYASKYEEMIPEIKKQVPEIKFFIGLNKEKDDDVSLSFDEFKATGKKVLEQGSTVYTDMEDDEFNLKMLVYTSGTTGDPKGVMLTEHNLMAVVANALKIAKIYKVSLSVLPYHHTYEAVPGLLLGVHNRTCQCINDSLKNVLKNLNLYKPEHIFLVPAFTEVFYKNIWATAEKTGKAKLLRKMIPVSNALRKVGIDMRGVFFKSVHDAFGGNLKEIICGGAPIRPEIGDFFNDIGIMLLNGYGISECSPLVSVNRPKFNDSNTVGVIMPCCEVKIENPDEDGNGEIWVKGDIVMKGYYKDPERTARVLKDGWFNTEDIGKVNEKGQLCINGRKKNLIVLDNGKNVYPEEIENYILAIPYVKECIVKSKKNEKGQEVALIAEVFLDEEQVKELNVENIEAKLKQDISDSTKELPTYKKISEVEIRKEEFVKTTTAKIKR